VHTPAFQAKRQFLQAPQTWGASAAGFSCIETHMSWLFLTTDRVYKIKKPVHFPYLDFTNLAARELYCREEVRLNTRLAPGIYLGLMALQWQDGRFSLVPEAALTAPRLTVDWLVVMQRLPADRMLPALMAARALTVAGVDALADALLAFYRSVTVLPMTPAAYLARFHFEQACNREVLLRPQFDLRDAASALKQLDRALQQGAALLQARARAGRIVDGHGDLRPEHVALLQVPVVIDCLEFNPQLRMVDPFDELAYLGLECSLAGAPWVGPRLVSRCAALLGDQPPAALLPLYTAHRALLRARLAMAHLLDPQPRTPQRWPALAQRYIDAAGPALREFNVALRPGWP
jgi:aminoglycoside phosphotransferase family enzyme